MILNLNLEDMNSMERYYLKRALDNLERPNGNSQEAKEFLKDLAQREYDEWLRKVGPAFAGGF